MKKILPLLIFISIAFGSNAQVHPGDEKRTFASGVSVVDDFTIISTTGDTLNLYNTLGSGKTVFIDLFYTRCVTCQQYAPIIEQIYQNTGAGQEDILFWGISDDLYDTDTIIEQYRIGYGVSNPCAGPEGNGVAAFNIITSGQNFFGYPTYCVICPDHTLFFDPVYPPTVGGFNPFFEECGAAVGIMDNPDNSVGTHIRSVFPNPSPGPVSILIHIDSPGDIGLQVRNIQGRAEMVERYSLAGGDSVIRLNTGNLSRGIYLVVLLVNGKPADKRIFLLSD